jgi:hypothetical protein
MVDLYVGLKQDVFDIEQVTFENRKYIVTFNDERMEHAVHKNLSNS